MGQSRRHDNPLLLVALLALVLLGQGIARAADPETADAPVAAVPIAATSSTSPSSELTYSPQWPEPPNTGAMLLRLCLGTAFVLALCVGSLYVGKPWLQKLQIKGPNSQALQIEGSVTLGNRATLYLVKIGDTQLVAGTDLTGLKSLIALPPSFKEVLDDQLPIEDPQTAVTPANFDARLRTAVGSQGVFHE